MQFKKWGSVTLILLTALIIFPIILQAANLLTNDGLEEPFVTYDTYTDPFSRTWDLKVAQGWEKFILSDGTYEEGRRLRFFSSSDWAAFNLSPFTEKRDGSNAQVWWSSELFDTGIYQQISGLSIGETYGFQAGTLQVFETTSSKAHGKMFRSVGIDPLGGTDPTSPNVVWSPEEGLDVDWFYPGVGAQAQAMTMTVFIRVRSIEEASTPNSNQVWIDDTFFDIAPNDTTLVLTKIAPLNIKATWSGIARSGFTIKGYEAQYRKTSETDWTDLQVLDSSNDFSTATNGTFAAEVGETYIVRARTWHEQDGGDSHEVPGPWVEETITFGGVVYGQVMDNRETTLNDLTVTASNGLTDTSDLTGNYALFTGAGDFKLTVSSLGNFNLPQPIVAEIPNEQTALPISITLRPADDAIVNGDFENGNLDAWTHNITKTNFISTGHRSGDKSLCFSTNATLTQTQVVSNMFRPTLSLWYKVSNGDGDDTLAVNALGADGVTAITSFTTKQVNDTWKHTWLDLGLDEVYTGTLGARINLNQSAPTLATVCLDEVSFGGARGGPNTLRLPIIIKS